MIPFPDPELRGEGFVLRRWTDADTDAYRVAMRDQETRRWLNDYDESAAEIDAQRVAGEALVLTIAEDESDAFLGFVALLLKEHHVGELAYMVTPEARGHGRAAAAVRLLGDWALAALALPRLQLRIDPANAPSIRVAERCGYRFEGVLRSVFELRGERVDSAMYSRLPTDLPI
jgi:[ribosomal protein S5]-alanine N-acetyltransferase